MYTRLRIKLDREIETSDTEHYSTMLRTMFGDDCDIEWKRPSIVWIVIKNGRTISEGYLPIPPAN